MVTIFVIRQALCLLPKVFALEVHRMTSQRWFDHDGFFEIP